MEPLGMKQINPQTYKRRSECPTHGEFEETGGSFFAQHTSPIMWFGCPACNVEAQRLDEAARKLEEEAQRQARIESRAKAAGIPMRFRESTLDSYVADGSEQDYALRVARDFADRFWTAHVHDGSFLLFYGEPGTGKSHLAIGICHEVMKRGTAMYTSVSSIVRRVRDTWRRDSEATEDDVLRMFGTLIDLLVIDEVGAQRGTEDEQLILFEIINRRYMDKRPTILITNLDEGALAAYMGARLIDRLVEQATSVPFTWESHRLKHRRSAA